MVKKYFFVVLLFLFVSPLTAQQKSVSLDDVLTLKSLGYTDKAILKELKNSHSKFRLKGADIARLKKAGIGGGVIEWMKSTAPVSAVTLAQILQWTKDGKTPAYILVKIAKRSKRPAFNAKTALKLMKARVHLSILFSLKGKALSKRAIINLAKKNTSPKAFATLLKMLGCDFKPGPRSSLSLLRAGVPSIVVRMLIRGIKKSSPPPVRASEFTAFDHVAREFRVWYPSSWKIKKELEDSNVTYFFTPQEVKSREKIHTGLSLFRIYLNETNPLYGLSLREVFRSLLSMLRAQEPGLIVTSKIQSCQVGSTKGIRSDLKGTLKNFPGKTFRGFFAAASKGQICYFITAQSQTKDEAVLGPIFKKMLKKMRLGPLVTSQREKIWSANQLVDQFKPSVVCVIAGNDKRWVASGSGFIVRKDGYVVTNHHVVWDRENNKFFTRFRIAWDMTLGKAPQSAVLIGARRETSADLIRSLTVGGADIGLLKIRGSATYKAVRLTPLRDVRLGDNVVAMGFPRLDLFSDPSGKNLSLFVTKGGLVRFNRNKKGKIKSIYTDAKITHGNSGGPCFNLSTGGVFGINTFGAWQSIERDLPKLKSLKLGDLVGYFGVIPLKYVFDEFPQFSRFEAGFDRNFSLQDHLILAQDFLNQRLFQGAILEVKRILELAPDNVDGLLIRGLALFFQSNYRDGLKALYQGLKKNPNHFGILLTLGTFYYQIRDNLKAADMIERAVALKKDDFSAKMTQARIYLAIKRYEEALKEARRAIKLVHSVLPDPYVLQGKILYAMGKLEEGRKSFQKAQATNPWDIPAWMGLGEYFERKNMYEAAIVEYAKLRRKRPKSPQSWEAIGHCYRKLKQYSKAYKFYQKAILLIIDRKQTPSENLLYHTVYLAQNVIKDSKITRILYGRYFNSYTSSRQSWRGHLEAAIFFRNQNKLGLSSAHYNRAKAHAPQEKRVREEQDRMTPTALGVTDLVLMKRMGYSSPVMIDLIGSSPLGFRIASKEDVKKLASLKIPVPVIIFILKIQKARGNRGGRTPVRTGIPQKLVGKWRGRSQTNGYPITIFLVVTAKGKFGMRLFNANGVAFRTLSGTISVSGKNILIFRILTPNKKVLKFRYSFVGNNLKLGSDIFYPI